MPNIAAVVLLFYPPEEVLQYIETYRKEVSHLYLVDNTDNSHASASLKDTVCTFPNVSLLQNAENIGVAKALNLALSHAEKDGFTWLLTMDQDSYFDQKEWSVYLEHFEKLDRDNVALVSPLHNPKFVNKMLKNPHVKQETVLSSGNLVKVQCALDVGGYDEKLFIDEVDHAFCFELLNKGYDIVQDQTVFLQHTLGTAFGKHGNIKLYAPFRLYYMLRNYLYIKKKYAVKFPLFFKKRGKYLVLFFMKQLLFSKDRVENIRMMKQGSRDYQNEIYGKKI